MAGKQEEEGRGFKVEDKRSFNPDGTARNEAGGGAAEGAAGGAADASAGGVVGGAADASAGGAVGGAADASADDPEDCGCEEEISKLPEIDFSTFVLSLASSVLMQLGEIPHPDTEKKTVNLPMAKQTIDILGVLQDKTRGNLDVEEARLLKELLYDLRMKYVTVCKGG